MHNLSEALHHFKKDRRRKVGSLLAQSMTESEIAQMLGVDQSTISRDVKALKVRILPTRKVVKHIS